MTDWSLLIQTLKAHGVEFSEPLSERETVTVEELFEFKFPADLRDFLQTALPSGTHFPDWRTCDEIHLRDWLNRPREGVLFDVEHNHFWLSEWG